MIYTTVAKILSPTQVVLSSGSEDGVKPGMEFVIYDLSDNIIDPETKEDLGQIELVKGRVIAEHVQDKITVAWTKARQVERRIPVVFRTTETVQDQLKIDGATPIQTDRVVRVGDRVRNLTEVASLPRLVTA